MIQPVLRRAWANYFKENKIRYVFWSAVNAQKLIDEENKRLQAEADEAARTEGAEESSDEEDELAGGEEVEKEEEDNEDLEDGEEVEEGDEEGDIYEMDDGEEDQWEDMDEEEEDGGAEELHEEELHDNDAERLICFPFSFFLFFFPFSFVSLAHTLSVHFSDEDIRVLTREELLENMVKLCPPKSEPPIFPSSFPVLRAHRLLFCLFFLSFFGGHQSTEEGARNIIGFVGYPNVGKSSTINVLCQAKKVAVAATPGKTKHFQVYFPFNFSKSVAQD